MGGSKEVFDAETFAIHQALRVLDSWQEAGRKYSVFSDPQPAIRRITSDELGQGQQWARAAVEVRSRLMARHNSVIVQWVPAHGGVAGNEEMAEGPSRDFSEVSNQVRWQVSLSHLHRRAIKRLSREAAHWVAAHVRPERRYHLWGARAFAAGRYARSGSLWLAETTSCFPGMPLSALFFTSA